MTTKVDGTKQAYTKRNGRRFNDGPANAIKLVVSVVFLFLALAGLVWHASGINSTAKANAKEITTVKTDQAVIKAKLGEIEKSQVRIETRQESNTEILKRLDARAEKDR